MGECPRTIPVDVSDGEFWTRVYGADMAPTVEDEWLEQEHELEQVTNQLGTCSVCGTSGPCAFDDEGRALIHVVPDADHEPAPWEV